MITFCIVLLFLNVYQYIFSCQFIVLYIINIISIISIISYLFEIKMSLHISSSRNVVVYNVCSHCTLQASLVHVIFIFKGFTVYFHLFYIFMYNLYEIDLK